MLELDNPVKGPKGLLARGRGSWTLKDLCAWLAPSLDVTVSSVERGREEVAVTANDWMTLSAEELLKRNFDWTWRGRLKESALGCASLVREIRSEEHTSELQSH